MNTKLAFDTIPSYYAGYDPGESNKIYGLKPKLERPKVLMIDGQPSYFFAPSGWNVEGGNRSVCYIMKYQ